MCRNSQRMCKKFSIKILKFKFGPHNNTKTVARHTVFKDLLTSDVGVSSETKNLTSEYYYNNLK